MGVNMGTRKNGIRKIEIGRMEIRRIEIRKMRTGILAVLLAAGLFLLGACGKRSGEKGEEGSTPGEVAEYTMESLKILDLHAFNACTDNHVRTYRNWIGIPVRREYRVFNELLQPGLIRGKRYESNYKFAEKIVEHMTWEIKEVRQDGEKAEVDMEITNLDMQDVLGQLEIHILESMLGSAGSGMGKMIKEMADLSGSREGLFSIMDSLEEEKICTLEVTVSAYQQKGQWKIHVSEEFINAFMGNMMAAEDYSEEIEQKIEELMEQNEKEMEEWGEEFSERVEKWAESVWEQGR